MKSERHQWGQPERFAHKTERQCLMAIRRRKDMAAQATIGDVVRSVPIGRCPEFVGSISSVAKWFVNVRDSAGREWHRSWGDLRDVEQAGESA